MKPKLTMFTYGSFFLKALVAANIIMFACMALGELVYERNLFSGFLTKPQLWAGIFFETVVATMLMTSLGSLILYRFRFSTKRLFARVSVVTWCGLGTALIVLYSHFYWTRGWHLTALAPGLIFGWILPGFLTIGCFVFLSFDLRQTDQRLN